MSVEFTDEQLAFRDSAAAFFREKVTPAEVRAAWEPDMAHHRSRWGQMASLGLLGVCIPESVGGLDLGEVDLVLILEEAGYVALPEPLLETAAVVAPVLARYGTAAQQERWLPAIASGQARATVQLMDSPTAAFAVDADLALVEADGRLHLLADDNLIAESVQSMDRGRHTGTIRAPRDGDSALPDGALAEAQLRGTAAAAAVLNGVSRRLLDMSVAYVQERQQFGRSVGSFQAVKHLLAEVAVTLETARPAAWYAARAIAETLPDRVVAASAAKAAAGRAAARANDHALQVHGGIGFTWELDLHLWLKRGKALEALFGTTGHHYRALGDAVLASHDLVADFGPVPTAVAR